jgi:glycolate oxidase FAD binding subunit
MALGSVPARYDVALRTTRLDRVLEYEPADLTVTVEAGVTMGRLQALLAEHGQFLPIDSPADATVGGVLAAGVSGPSRHAYGLPRDWLLGCRVAHADGSVSKGGGRVVKNVAGYDLPKLTVGSLGTLGVVVEVSIKVAPLPALQETFLASYPSLEAAVEACFAADERGLALRALALRRDAQDAALVACWLAGPRAAVERTARELAALAGDAETRRLEGAESERWWAELDRAGAAPEGAVTLRASLPPSAVIDFMQHLDALGREAGLTIATLAYPTTGLVLAQLSDALVEQLTSAIEEARRQAAKASGSLVVAAAPVAVKERIDVWGDAGSALPLMRCLKEQFDPQGTLNPGRFVGGL